MELESIPTYCRHCRMTFPLEEAGYCPRCRKGPAVPSSDRVDIITGAPVMLSSHPYMQNLAGTRPAFQTIGAPPRTTAMRGLVSGTRALSMGEVPVTTTRRPRARLFPDPLPKFLAVIDDLTAHDRKLSKTVVADAMGINRTTVDDWIAAKRLPPWPWDDLARQRRRGVR